MKAFWIVFETRKGGIHNLPFQLCSEKWTLDLWIRKFCTQCIMDRFIWKYWIMGSCVYLFQTLFQSSCTLRYHGNGSFGSYGVAITLEDFPRGTWDFNNTRPLSQVGLQFIVQILSNNGSCNQKPYFTGLTPSDGACVQIAAGSTYRAILVGQHVDSSER